MPALTVWEKPKGLPMATTHSPTSSSSLSPNGATGSSPGSPSSLMTARSVAGSAPTGLASKVRPSSSFTFNSSASATTWLLVRM